MALLDASVPDSGTAIDSGVEGPVRLRDIALTINGRDSLSFPPFDGGEIPLSFPRRDDIRAQWRQRDGGWGLATGSLLDDGGYLIPAVPEGDAVIFVRSSPFAVVTTASSLDMSYVVSGRKDAIAAPPNVPTTLNCAFFDMNPWEPANDRWVIASFEAPFAENILNANPPAGLTSSTLPVPLHQLSLPLPEGRLGDTVSLFQLRRRQAGPLTYRSMLSGSTVRAPNMSPGATETVVMPFTSPFDGGVDLDLDVPSLVDVARAVRPAPAPVNTITFGINAVRNHRAVGQVNRGFRGNLSNVTVVDAEPLLPTVGRVQQRIEWATLVSSEDLLAYVFVRTDIRVQGPTFSGIFDAYHERFAPLDGPTLTMGGALTPPRDIRVNGMSGALSAVGLTPRISWLPPERGSPARYTVSFQRAVFQNGSITWSEASSFATTQTSLEVPPFALQSGVVYAVEVRAWSGAFNPRQPGFLPSDVEISANVSDLFSP